MGNSMLRKMKRTKQQELRVIESMNREAIGRLFQQQAGIAQALVDLQKNHLSLVNLLKRRQIVDDLLLHRELGEIEEFERMKRSAMIIDPNKPDIPIDPKIKEG